MHVARRFTSNTPPDNIPVKLDFSNSFNCLHKDFMLERVSEVVSQLYEFCYLAHCQNSTLPFDHFSILSEEGPQQGDPLEGIFYCLAVHSILRSTVSPLTMGFKDDISRGDLCPLYPQKLTFFESDSQNRPSTQCLQVRGYFQGPAQTQWIACWLSHITSG